MMTSSTSPVELRQDVGQVLRLIERRNHSCYGWASERSQSASAWRRIANSSRKRTQTRPTRAAAVSPTLFPSLVSAASVPGSSLTGPNLRNCRSSFLTLLPEKHKGQGT